MGKEAASGTGKEDLDVFEGAQIAERRFGVKDLVTQDEHVVLEKAAVVKQGAFVYPKEVRYPLSWSVTNREGILLHTSEWKYQKFSNNNFIFPVELTVRFADGKVRRCEVERDESGNELEGREYYDGKLVYQKRMSYGEDGMTFIRKEHYDPATSKLIEGYERRLSGDNVIMQSYYEQDGKIKPGRKVILPHQGPKGHLEYLGYLLI